MVFHGRKTDNNISSKFRLRFSIAIVINSSNRNDKYIYNELKNINVLNFNKNIHFYCIKQNLIKYIFYFEKVQTFIRHTKTKLIITCKLCITL